MGEQRRKRIWETYAESSRKRLTLCMVMRAVGDDEMMMMGWLWPTLDFLGSLKL